MDTSSEQLIPPTDQQVTEHDPNVEAIQIENETEPEANDQSGAHSSEVVIDATSASEESQESTKDGQGQDDTDSAVIDVQPELQEPVPQNDDQLQESNEASSSSSSSSRSSSSTSSSRSSSSTSSSSSSASTPPLEASSSNEGCCRSKSCCVSCSDCTIFRCTPDSTESRVCVDTCVLLMYLLLLAVPISAIVMGLDGQANCPISPTVGTLVFVMGLLGTISLTIKVIELLQKCFTRRTRSCFRDHLDVVLFMCIFTTLLAELVILLGLSPRNKPTSSKYCDPIFYHYAFYMSWGVFLLMVTISLVYCGNCVYGNPNVPVPRVMNVNGVFQNGIPAMHRDV